MTVTPEDFHYIIDRNFVIFYGALDLNLGYDRGSEDSNFYKALNLDL